MSGNNEKNGQLNIALKRIFRIIIFLVIFIVINTMICSSIFPSAHKSNEMWNKFYYKDDADIVFVGSSVAEMINPNVVEAYMGRACVNMATPSQYFATSRNLVEIAAGQRDIDTVVLLMGFDALERDEDMTSSLAVEKAYYDNDGVLGKLLGFLSVNAQYSMESRNIISNDSINRWMSWPVACIKYFDETQSNWEKKQYYGELYENLKLDKERSDLYKRVSMPGPEDISDECRREISEISSIDISEDSLKVLGQIADYCNSNGIRLLVAISPHRTDYAGSFDNDDYARLDAFTRSYVEGKGCMYVNINDLPSTHELLTDDYFTDSEHVNEDGIEVASGIMSDILKLLIGG